MGAESDIRIQAVIDKGWAGRLLRIFGPALDRVLGIRRLRLAYERHGFRGLDKDAFVARFIEVFKLRCRFDPEELGRIPQKGPVVIVANHPLGGLEGILLLSILKAVRPDYKVFVNIVQYYLKEIADFFIFTNPMFPGSKENRAALRQARAWLSGGHCFAVFPAGRVGIYRPDRGYVSDETWDKVALSLSLSTGAEIVPIHVGGSCSRAFSALSRFIFPMKLFMLVWEFLDSLKKEVAFTVGRPIRTEGLEAMGRSRANAWLRMRVYLLAPLTPGRIALDAPPGDAALDPAPIGGQALFHDGPYAAYRLAGRIQIREAADGRTIAACAYRDGERGRELLGIQAPGDGAFAAGPLLWRALAGRGSLSGRLELRPPGGTGRYGEKSIALLAAALAPRQKRYRATRKGHIAVLPRPHPEVEDYFRARGAREAELMEAIRAVEGRDLGLPLLCKELLASGARFSLPEEAQSGPYLEFSAGNA